MKLCKIMSLALVMLALTACGETKKININDGEPSAIVTKLPENAPSNSQPQQLNPVVVEKYGEKLAQYHNVQIKRSFEAAFGNESITVNYDCYSTVSKEGIDVVYKYRTLLNDETDREKLCNVFIGAGPYYCCGCHASKQYWDEVIDDYKRIMGIKKAELEKGTAEGLSEKEIEYLQAEIAYYEYWINDAEKRKANAAEESKEIKDFDHTAIYGYSDDGKNKIVIEFPLREIEEKYMRCNIREYPLGENVMDKSTEEHEVIINSLLDKANIWNVKLSNPSGDVIFEDGSKGIVYNMSPLQEKSDPILPSLWEFIIKDDKIDINLNLPEELLFKTEDVTLLSLKEIEGIADMIFRENIQDFEDYFNKGRLNIADIRLELMCDMESESVVPVWNFYSLTGPDEWLKKRPLISLNAIDGSVVSMYDPSISSTK